MQDTMNCIYKMDIEYCLHQALYEVETNQILQLHAVLFSIFQIQVHVREWG